MSKQKPDKSPSFLEPGADRNLVSGRDLRFRPRSAVRQAAKCMQKNAPDSRWTPRKRRPTQAETRGPSSLNFARTKCGIFRPILRDGIRQGQRRFANPYCAKFPHCASLGNVNRECQHRDFGAEHDVSTRRTMSNHGL